MEDIIVPIGVCGMLFVALPWILFHYITRWKTAATLTTGDEALLDELYHLARRLEERMETVERLVGNDHPDFRSASFGAAIGGDDLRADIDRLRTASERIAR